jgi:hypothetical protein
VRSAEAPGLLLGIGLGGDEDDRDALHRRIALHGLQQLQAVEVRHVDVDQHQVGMLLLHDQAPGHAVLGDQHFIAGAGQVELEKLPDHLVVVHDEYLGHA